MNTPYQSPLAQAFRLAEKINLRSGNALQQSQALLKITTPGHLSRSNRIALDYVARCADEAQAVACDLEKILADALPLLADYQASVERQVAELERAATCCDTYHTTTARLEKAANAKAEAAVALAEYLTNIRPSL
jgi:hypothetical protein